MTNSYKCLGIRNQAGKVLKVWKANLEFRLQDISLEDYEKMFDDLDGVIKKIEAQNRELDELKSVREKLSARLVPLNSRARSGMRGYFGPKSPEFASVKIQQSQKAGRKAKKPALEESDAAEPGWLDATEMNGPWRVRRARKPGSAKSTAPSTPPPAIPALAPAATPEPAAV